MCASPILDGDRHANIELINRLTLWLDEHIASEPSEIFAREVTVNTPGGEAVGFEAAVAQARRTHDATEVNQHLTTNAMVQLDGDAATIRANFIVAFGPTAMDGPARMMGGLYLLDTRKERAGWRIVRLEVKPLWRAGEW